MPFDLAFGLWAGVSLLVAALASNRRRAAIGVALSATLLPVPFLAPPAPLTRLFLASAIIWLVVRAADLLHGLPPPSPLVRWVHLVALPDVRLATRTAPALHLGLMVGGFLSLVVLLGSVVVLGSGRFISSWFGHAIQWLAIGVATMSAFNLVAILLRVASTAAGVDIPALNDAPLRSRSLSDFWANRWNRAVTRMLRDLCFTPLSRRSSAGALLACFVASAAIHAYAMAAAAGAVAALSWSAFFMLQPIAIAVERRLRVRRWPALAGRLWTALILLILLPLFAEPLRQIANHSSTIRSRYFVMGNRPPDPSLQRTPPG